MFVITTEYAQSSAQCAVCSSTYNEQYIRSSTTDYWLLSIIASCLLQSTVYSAIVTVNGLHDVLSCTPVYYMMRVKLKSFSSLELINEKMELLAKHSLRHDMYIVHTYVLALVRLRNKLAPPWSMHANMYSWFDYTQSTPQHHSNYSNHTTTQHTCIATSTFLECSRWCTKSTGNLPKRWGNIAKLARTL